MTKKTLIILGGPTGVGKTDFAIRLAKKFESEIIYVIYWNKSRCNKRTPREK